VSDTLIGSRTVGGLLVGASNSGSLTWRIPRGTSKGTYHIIARADAGGGVTETNETNNVRSISIDVK
jgi:subtilase family serine protease